MGVSVIRALLGTAVISAPFVLTFSMVALEGAKQLPNNERGSLCGRIMEIAWANLARRSIKDPYTADRHVRLVAKLPSKKCVQSSKEQNAQPPIQPFPVFRDTPNRFEFGLTPETRASIIAGRYIQCSSGLATVMGVDSRSLEPTLGFADLEDGDLLSLSPIKVLITDTQNPCVCEEFNKALIGDFARMAKTEDRMRTSKRVQQKKPSESNDSYFIRELLRGCD